MPSPSELPLQVLERAAAVVRAADATADAGDVLGCLMVALVLGARELPMSREDLVRLVGETYDDTVRMALRRRTSRSGLPS